MNKKNQLSNNVKRMGKPRRSFLFGAVKSLASLAVANAGLYLVGSAFKKLDGSFMAAGGKQVN